MLVEEGHVLRALLQAIAGEVKTWHMETARGVCETTAGESLLATL
jgi:hypothetical protein